MYAKIENNQVVEWPIINLREKFPLVSLPETLTDENMPENYVIVHQIPEPQYDTLTHKLVSNVLPVFNVNTNQWEQGYNIEELNQDEKQMQITALSNFIRNTRNQLLAASDWTQVADAPVDKQAWANYRQQLRDVTNQSGFPTQVDWPTKP